MKFANQFHYLSLIALNVGWKWVFQSDKDQYLARQGQIGSEPNMNLNNYVCYQFWTLSFYTTEVGNQNSWSLSQTHKSPSL